ncbi:MAG: glycosyltransferase family 4 protein [Planctomycetota bacterium]|nr:glycosyltransferase family 4 protein [Planctomycetota bacterium]
MLRLAYLNSEYPSLSHTFIEREVQDARSRGIEVHTFTVRPAGATGRLSQAHDAEARTTCVLMNGAWGLFVSSLRTLLTHPVGFLRGLVRSQRLALPGVRSRLWHLAYLLEAARLVEELRSRGLNHVHVHMANNAASIALLASKIDPSIQYSLTVHGSAEFFAVEEVRLADKVREAVFVRTISQFCRAQIMAWTDPAFWDRFHVVHCGVNLQSFSPKAPAPAPNVTGAADLTTAAAGTAGISGNPSRPRLRILTVGRLHPIKGYPQMLEACKHLTDAGVDWSWTVVGDGELRRDLEERVQKLDLGQRVRFSGAVGQDDIQPYFDDADVLVVSSFMEGVPVVLMEAMAKEMAVVSTRVGGVPELVEDGREGLLVDPGSAPALAKALVRLAHDPSLRRSLGANARQKIAAQFDIHGIGNQVAELFERYVDADVDADVEPAQGKN